MSPERKPQKDVAAIHNLLDREVKNASQKHSSPERRPVIEKTPEYEILKHYAITQAPSSDYYDGDESARNPFIEPKSSMDPEYASVFVFQGDIRAEHVAEQILNDDNRTRKGAIDSNLRRSMKAELEQTLVNIIPEAIKQRWQKEDQNDPA